MRIYFSLLFCAFFLSVSAQKTIKCAIETSLGIINLELYQEAAPITVANFLSYVDAKAYDGSSFFRVCTPENEAERAIKIEVIQGGSIKDEMRREPIDIETTKATRILHENGTISMARGKPNSATSSFFICIGAQPELDFGGKRNPDGYGFAAFGKVIQGLSIVKEIQRGVNTNQLLDTPVEIISISRK